MAPNNVNELKEKLENAIREINTDEVHDFAKELSDLDVDMKEFYTMADMLNRVKRYRGYYTKVMEILWIYV